MKYCAKCGIENNDDVLFCMNCGNKFEINTEPEPQEQTPELEQQSEQSQQPPQFYAPQSQPELEPEQSQQQQPFQQQYQQPPQQPQYYQPYQQQPPQMGYYVQPQIPVPGKGMAIASLILGICSLVWGWIGIGLVTGIVGIVLGIMGGKKMRMAGFPSGMATAGLVMSIIGTVMGGIIFATCFVAVGVAGCYAPTLF